MTDSLKHKTIAALAWMTLDTVVVRLAGLIVGIIIARLLVPADYGVIGMLAIFIAMGESLVDAGFGTALIQRKNANDTDYSTIFYFNILVALLMYFALFFSATAIADFYNEERLVLLAKLLGLNFIISAFTLIQRTILTKALDFKTQMKVSVISVIVSAVIGLYMAYAGYGVFALVAQILAKSVVNALLLWILSEWRPSLVFSFASLKSLFSFGSKLLISGILDVIFSNLNIIVIGKIFSVQALGFYTKAKELQAMPSATLTSIINRVSFPTFSLIQDDKQRLLRGFSKAQQLSVFIIFPVMALIMVCSKIFIPLLLTEKWVPAVPFLQLLAVLGAFYPVHVLNLNILNVNGRSDLFLKLEIVKKCLIALILFITYRWGIMAMIYGQIAQSFICLFINSHYSMKLIGYGASRQFKDIAPALCISLIMACLVYALGEIMSASLLLVLLAQFGGALLIYLGLAYLFKLNAFVEIVDIVSQKVFKR